MGYVSFKDQDTYYYSHQPHLATDANTITQTISKAHQDNSTMFLVLKRRIFFQLSGKPAVKPVEVEV